MRFCCGASLADIPESRMTSCHVGVLCSAAFAGLINAHPVLIEHALSVAPGARRADLTSSAAAGGGAEGDGPGRRQAGQPGPVPLRAAARRRAGVLCACHVLCGHGFAGPMWQTNAASQPLLSARCSDCRQCPTTTGSKSRACVQCSSSARCALRRFAARRSCSSGWRWRSSGRGRRGASVRRRTRPRRVCGAISK